MRTCEIIYVKKASGEGWKWRALESDGKPAAEVSKETFELFYECVTHARKNGYQPNQKCL
jgi:hypothetical protein